MCAPLWPGGLRWPCSLGPIARSGAHSAVSVMSPLLGQRQAMLQSRSSGAPAQLPACGRRAVPKAALRAAHSHQPLAHCCPVAPQLHHRSPLQRQQQAAALGQACAGPQHSSSSRPQARVHAAAADGGDASAAAATQQGTSSFTQAVFNVVSVRRHARSLALREDGRCGLMHWRVGGPHSRQSARADLAGLGAARSSRAAGAHFGGNSKGRPASTQAMSARGSPCTVHRSTS